MNRTELIKHVKRQKTKIGQFNELVGKLSQDMRHKGDKCIEC